MNTQKIKLLLTALEEGSLTKAGNKLGYTQSGVSQTIRSLEEELGFPLLIKSNTGVEATSYTEVLLPTMRAIVSSEEKMQQEVAELRGFHKGTITVGSFISTSMNWLPQALSFFKDNYPGIEFRIKEFGQADIVNALYDGTVEVALMSDPYDKELDFIPILEDPMVVVFSEEYDLSDHDSVKVSEICELPLLLTEADVDRDARMVFAKSGYTPHIRYTSKDDFTILSMVKHGLGVAVLPELLISGFPEAFDYRILEPEFYRTVGIGLRSLKDASPLVKLFIRYIRENIR